MILERGEGWEASGHQEREGPPQARPSPRRTDRCLVSPTHGVFLVNCSQLSEDLNEQGDSMDLTIFGGIRVVACRVAPVEVNIVPASLLPLPHPRLLCLGGEGVTLFVQGLSNLDIADGGGIIPQQVDHGTQNCDI